MKQVAAFIIGSMLLLGLLATPFLILLWGADSSDVLGALELAGLLFL